MIQQLFNSPSPEVTTTALFRCTLYYLETLHDLPWYKVDLIDLWFRCWLKVREYRRDPQSWRLENEQALARAAEDESRKACDVCVQIPTNAPTPPGFIDITTCDDDTMARTLIPEPFRFCARCDSELSRANGSLMDKSFLTVPHTCSKEEQELRAEWQKTVEYLGEKGYWATYNALVESGPEKGIDYAALRKD